MGYSERLQAVENTCSEQKQLAKAGDSQVAINVSSHMKQGDDDDEVGPGEEPSAYSGAVAASWPINLKKTAFAMAMVLAMLLIVAFLVTSLLVDKLDESYLAGLRIWQWCVFAISIVCGFSLVLGVYWPIFFLVEKRFMLNQRVIYFLHGLRRSGAFLIWWIWVLLMWLILLENKIKDASPGATKVLRIATRTITSLVIGSIAWVLLTIGLRLLSVKCRFNRYIDRIQVAAFELNVLWSLSAPEHTDVSDFLNRCLTATGAWIAGSPPKDDGKISTKLARIYMQKRQRVQLFDWDSLIDSVEDDGFSSVQQGSKIDTEENATKTARKIFLNVAKRDKSCITGEDLLVYLIPDEVELLDQLKFLKTSEKITLEEFTNWVLKVKQDRKLLAQALSDNKSAVQELSLILRAVLVIIGVISWLLWIDILTTKQLAAFLTGLAGVTFVFGDSVKTVFQSIIFVFVVHPFDIGDHCIIEDTQMVVEEMNIMTTVFLKTNNEKAYYPNFSLSTKAIVNLNRSPLLRGSVRFSIDYKTATDKIQKLKEDITKFCEETELLGPSFGLVVEGFDGKNSIKMVLHCSFKTDIQDFSEVSTRAKEITEHLRETIVVPELEKILVAQKITFNLIPAK